MDTRVTKRLEVTAVAGFGSALRLVNRFVIVTVVALVVTFVIVR